MNCSVNPRVPRRSHLCEGGSSTVASRKRTKTIGAFDGSTRAIPASSHDFTGMNPMES